MWNIVIVTVLMTMFGNFNICVSSGLVLMYVFILSHYRSPFSPFLYLGIVYWIPDIVIFSLMGAGYFCSHPLIWDTVKLLEAFQDLLLRVIRQS